MICVDDNPHVCEALRLRLEERSGLQIVGQLSTAAGLRELVEATDAAIVLMDIDMPGPDPFGAVAALREAIPDCRVVMFTGHVRRELVDRALDAGAWGYLSKQDGPDEVISALRRVGQGEVVLGRDVEAVYGAG